ncbi:tryptophan 7-halogenase [Pseudomaricurvus alkylphenolicus]|uniref:tryptophan 7-halogenase n=1 Tax=Pseudomaricurvus alkylphenolicus TaxID=1306991 RepID=UPI0014240C2A|nr:tryptophan 7-halogenase [Pseudomaricurvus alkylphenolicus]
MESQINSVVIVGGGTAGWITAARLAHDHCANQPGGLTVTLIESPDVGPIGVGEGSWPTLRVTLREIGVSESDFIRECEVSFKQGSKFVAWRTGADNDFYYHPFMPPEGALDIDVNRAWLKHQPEAPFAYAVSAQPQLCEEGLAPKQVQTPEYAAFSNYGYHLNADKFGAFLRRYCIEKLGVNYIEDHITGVNAAEDGHIRSLSCRASGEITGDLFVDCTGGRGLLINQHFKAPFVDCTDVLFNNKALAVQVPYDTPDQNIASATISTAQSSGWIWDIGLQTRRGMGYVYSSAHIERDQVWEALQAHIASTSRVNIETLTPRELSFRPGYRSTPWVKNCVAVGMSSGFVEPLEASAIAMVEICAKTISNELPATKAAMAIVAQRYNQRFVERWDSIVEFLKLHYWLSERDDSDYWRDNRRPDTLPQHLTEMLELWKHQIPSTADFHQILELFGPPSYQYILYGMGYKPADRVTRSRRDNDEIAAQVFQSVSDSLKKGLRGLPTNRSLLNAITQRSGEGI